MGRNWEDEVRGSVDGKDIFAEDTGGGLAKGTDEVIEVLTIEVGGAMADSAGGAVVLSCEFEMETGGNVWLEDGPVFAGD